MRRWRETRPGTGSIANQYCNTAASESTTHVVRAVRVAIFSRYRLVRPPMRVVLALIDRPIQHDLIAPSSAVD